MDYVKRAERHSIPTEDEYFLTQSDKEASPEEKYLEQEVKRQLSERCNNLKSPYREIALDYFCRELPAAEIAANSGKNLKTVQTQIYRARAMLQKTYRKGALSSE